MCKSWCEAIIGIIILVFALFWYTWMYSQWIIAIAAVVLIIHSFTCKSCFAGKGMSMTKRRR